MSIRFWSIVTLVVAFVSGAASATPLNATLVRNGGYHTCAVVGGGVQCWGDGYDGQLGNGSYRDSGAPVVVKGAESGVTALTSGLEHSCALVGGAVKCWGRNPDGEVGDGTVDDVPTAVPVQTLGSGVVAIAAGQYHTCAIIAGGAVKCWGWNSNGQLGDGSQTATNTNPPVAVSGVTGATALAAGGYHTCALVAGGVKCWGYNGHGELDNGGTSDSHTAVAANGLSGVTAISAGTYHTCALVAGGAMKCWGWNSDGQLGNGTTTQTGTGAPVTPTGITASVGAFATGGYHTCAAISGAVKCWGDNYYGQLGIGTLVSKLSPTAVPALNGVTALSAGAYTTCAMTSISGGTQTTCWGDNYDGELGLGDSVYRTAPVTVAGITGATRVSHGTSARHTCAVVAGAVKCWGYGELGELGNGATVSSSLPVAVTGLSSGATDVAVGSDSSCALVGGAVKCWGDNTDGQLGNGSTTQSNTPVVAIASGASAIAVGYFHACAIVSGGVKCWGYNGDGELGDGTVALRTSPVSVVGLGGTPVSISAGAAHTCVTLTTGSIRCWGYNSNGQLGDGTINSTKTNPPVTVANIASGATLVGAGGYHTCAIVSGGAQCWGYGQLGGLGNGTTSDSLIPVAVTGWDSGAQLLAGGNNYTCGVKSGAASCWGANYDGGLGNGTVAYTTTPVAVIGATANVTSIGGADSHTCAVINGAVSCWGSDFYGELADGRTVYAPSPKVVSGADAIFADGFDD